MIVARASMAALLLAISATSAAAGESEYGPFSPMAWGQFHHETTTLARCVRTEREAASQDWMARLEASGQDGEFRELVLRLLPGGAASAPGLDSAISPYDRYVLGMSALSDAGTKTLFESTRKLAVMTYFELPATQGRCTASETFLESYRKSLPGP